MDCSSHSNQVNVKKFHELVKEGLDYETVAHMIEESIVHVDCTDQRISNDHGRDEIKYIQQMCPAFKRSQAEVEVNLNTINEHFQVLVELLYMKASVKDLKFGNTPLMLGSWCGRSTMSCMLIEFGADINAKNQLGASPLNHSLSNRQIDTTLLLLRRGANPNNKTTNGNIPLLFAIQLGLTDLCRELLRYGADLDVQLGDGASAVFLASQNGNLDLLRLLAASGADLGMVRRDQTNALLIACQIGHTDIVAELLTCYKQQRDAHQKDTTKKANTTKHIDIIRRCAKKAAIKGFEDIVKLLMEHADLLDDSL